MKQKRIKKNHMIKTKYIIPVVFILSLFFCCKNAEYESWKIPASNDKIIRVNLSPNSPVLIADGKSTLSFDVRAYRAVEHTRPVEEVDENANIRVVEKTFRDTVEIANDRISSDRIKIFLEDGTVVGNRFTTNNLNSKQITFQASVDNVLSEKRTVIIRPPKELNFAPIEIPVIFHVVSSKRSATTCKNIKSEDLQKLLDRTNKIFKNEIINAPSSVDTKVKFVLAKHDMYNKELKEIGINRVDAVFSEHENVHAWINKNKYRMVWNPNKFLNIYIADLDVGYSLDCGAQGPSYILNNGTELETYGRMQKVNKIEDATWWSYAEVGIRISIYDIFSMYEGMGSTYKFEYLIGRFFGLEPTFERVGVGEGSIDDFCEDTHHAILIYVSPFKWTKVDAGKKRNYKDGTEIYYRSFNIMDVYTTGTTITYDQAIRMRTVMKNCPLRLFDHSQDSQK